MKKDIFIDNNVASKFTNPQDKEYIKLTKWLLNYDNSNPNKDDFAHLVVSQKLLVEYLRSAIGSTSGTAISGIISTLQKEDRLVIIKKSEIEDFKHKHYSKTLERKFKCNSEDRDLIPVVLKSDRKFALTYDQNFTHDLENFPGYNVLVKKRPEDIPYE